MQLQACRGKTHKDQTEFSTLFLPPLPSPLQLFTFFPGLSIVPSPPHPNIQHKLFVPLKNLFLLFILWDTSHLHVLQFIILNLCFYISVNIFDGDKVSKFTVLMYKVIGHYQHEKQKCLSPHRISGLPFSTSQLQSQDLDHIVSSLSHHSVLKTFYQYSHLISFQCHCSSLHFESVIQCPGFISDKYCPQPLFGSLYVSKLIWYLSFSLQLIFARLILSSVIQVALDCMPLIFQLIQASWQSMSL